MRKGEPPAVQTPAREHRCPSPALWNQRQIEFSGRFQNRTGSVKNPPTAPPPGTSTSPSGKCLLPVIPIRAAGPILRDESTAPEETHGRPSASEPLRSCTDLCLQAHS